MCYPRFRDDPKEFVRAALHDVVDELIDGTPSQCGMKEEVESGTPESVDPLLIPPEMKEEFQSMLQSFSGGSVLEDGSPGEQEAERSSQVKPGPCCQDDAKGQPGAEESFSEQLKIFFRKLLDSFKEITSRIVETVWGWIKSFLKFLFGA